jgi:hypothetical protein
MARLGSERKILSPIRYLPARKSMTFPQANSYLKKNFAYLLLRQFESIFKTALAHESGDAGVPFKEIKPRVENLVRLSL